MVVTNCQEISLFLILLIHTLWYFSGEICLHRGLPKSTQSLHTTETALAWTRESGSNIASIILAMCCKFCKQVNSLKKSTLFTRSILTEKYWMSLVGKKCFKLTPIWICRLLRSISNPTEFTSHTDTVFGIPLHFLSAQQDFSTCCYT